MDGAPKYIPPITGRELPTAPQLRRLKFGWRVLLFCNFALGAYLFAAPKKKSNHEQKSSVVEETPPIPVETTAQFYEGLVASPPLPDSIKMQLQPLMEKSRETSINVGYQERSAQSRSLRYSASGVSVPFLGQKGLGITFRFFWWRAVGNSTTGKSSYYI